MQLDIITPEKSFFSGDAYLITIPGSEGEFGVLDGHSPFISTLRHGVITIDLPGNEQRKIAVKGGIAEVVPERCTVLIEKAVDCTAMSAAEAENAAAAL